MVAYSQIIVSLFLFPNEGPNRRIAIVIDNATWHSELTESTKPAKRSMRKDQIIEWLENHRIDFDSTLKK